QGRRYDEETGLYYFRNRQYDPVHGRFLSRDPMGYRDSFCLYQFVNNNPVCYVDPMGWTKLKIQADYESAMWEVLTGINLGTGLCISTWIQAGNIECGEDAGYKFATDDPPLADYSTRTYLVALGWHIVAQTQQKEKISRKSKGKDQEGYRYYAHFLMIEALSVSVGASAGGSVSVSTILETQRYYYKITLKLWADGSSNGSLELSYNPHDKDYHRFRITGNNGEDWSRNWSNPIKGWPYHPEKFW
ncbi:MAG: hypothetical protein DRP79_06100, partial [Planctomycetota bacterium]